MSREKLPECRRLGGPRVHQPVDGGGEQLTEKLVSNTATEMDSLHRLFGDVEKTIEDECGTGREADQDPPGHIDLVVRLDNRSLLAPNI